MTDSPVGNKETHSKADSQTHDSTKDAEKVCNTGKAQTKTKHELTNIEESGAIRKKQRQTKDGEQTDTQRVRRQESSKFLLVALSNWLVSRRQSGSESSRRVLMWFM